MFNDDVSAIPTTGCNVVNSQSVIYNYSNGIRTTFTQIGGKWFKTSESTYTYNPSGLVCVNVSELNSNAQLVPFYYMTAFVLFAVSVFVFIKSIRGFFYGP